MKNDHYKIPKNTLYVICPKIIKAMRLPEADGTAGRRTGEPNLDEVSGANDILYHLMCNETITHMAAQAGISPLRMIEVLNGGLMRIEK